MRLQTLHNPLGVRQLGLVGSVNDQYDTLQGKGAIGLSVQTA